MLNQEIIESTNSPDSPFIEKPIYFKISGGVVYVGRVTAGTKVSLGLMRKVLSTGIEFFAHKSSSEFLKDDLKDPKQELPGAYRGGACLFLGGVYNSSPTLSFGGHIKGGYALPFFSDEKVSLASFSAEKESSAKERTTGDLSGGMCFGGEGFIKLFVIQGIAVDVTLLGMYYLGDAKGYMVGVYPGISFHFNASFIQDAIFKTAIKTAVKASVGTIVTKKTNDWLNS